MSKKHPKEPTESIRIRQSVYLALIAKHEETGIPIIDLASRAISIQLTQSEHGGALVGMEYILERVRNEYQK